MDTSPKLSNRNLPTRLPLVASICLWLLLDRLAVPGWAWGVYWTLIVIVWASCIFLLVKENHLDVFKILALKRDKNDY